ncbi:hypothetical protein FRX94_01020 [Corynebacterium canis]|uniref:Uncharacterized protein n=1 Tax=Corynebacterium canis TaxID=679663 RepID=A0A5C5UR71_9CORY|nr:hypothetical protein [Corynebacterium canis]TWT28804.1 hypothetical protein FRX94_01020 [Corynebacterium canis]WJY74932.1 hypothetical protein CCANI_05425 [Corynebacterium canis]
MLNVFHHKEPFGDSGSTYGTSTKKALGRPNLHRWEMFTRETLQNSWDARDTGGHTDGVTFAIDYKTLDEPAVTQLREFFGEDLTGVEDSLGEFLKRDNLPLIVVSDSGTCGLQGPTSAATHVDCKDDFVSFIRNIGRSSDKAVGGGTYGFGKGVFFDASKVNAVLVYTRTRDEEGNRVNRFIAMAISEAFHIDELNFTGRHWWGVQADGVTGGDFAEPFVGEEADKLATAFGMDEHFTEHRPTGTSVAVLDPAFEAPADSEMDDDALTKYCMDNIAKSLTKWAWPHMVVQHKNMGPLNFVVKNRGEDVTIPDPMEDPGLIHIVRAYKELIKHPEPQYHEITDEWTGSSRYRMRDIISKRPAEYLGKLCLYRLSRIPEESTTAGESYDRHIALMRNPRMVVDYWVGPKGAVGSGYGGVFVASTSLDGIFAASEPPAHDEWNPKTVDLSDPRFFQEGKTKQRRTNPVKVAFMRLRDHIKELTPSTIKVIKSVSSPAIVELSHDLGRILSDGTGGRTPKVKQPQSRAAAVKKTPRAGIATSTNIETMEVTSRGTVVVFQVTAKLSKAAAQHGATLQIHPVSVVDGKRYTKRGEGVSLAMPLGWVDPYDPTLDWEKLAAQADAPQQTLVNITDDSWEGYIALLQPENTAIMLNVSTEANSAPIMRGEEQEDN